MSDFAKKFEEHLKTQHKRNPFSGDVREIVYGGTDGIVTTFAVIAGFMGASSMGVELAMWTVLLFGFANLFADGVSMALGDFLSIRAEQDVYQSQKRKEKTEIEQDFGYEIQETEYLLSQQGFSVQDAKTLTKIYSKNKPFWLDFMMLHELDMPNSRDEKPVRNALFTFISFIIFGFLPLLPYLIFTDEWLAFWSAVVAFFVALLILGIVRGIVTGEKVIRAALEVLLIGSLAGLVAFGVGFFFR